MKRLLHALVLTVGGLAGILSASSSAYAEDYALLIGGLGGEERYSQEFLDSATALRTTLIERHGYHADRVRVFAETAPAERHVDCVSTLENIQREFGRLQTVLQAGDSLLVIAVGHGQSDYQETKLNLPGPDLSAQGLTALLNALPNTDHQTLVLSFPCSGQFAEVLARAGRVVLASTDGPRQIYHSVMTQYLLQAMQSDAADVNADGAVSLYELFDFLSLQVEGHFTAAGTLQTENPSLDDNGDGKVTTLAEGMDAGDGELAKVTYIAPAVRAVSAGGLPAEREGGITP
ncbi:MAG: hypothetical protein IT365_11520 [Candidatus Hydrogenedentes bacterium]|nr:hypothetical protein [Candidatus Hydrogenedentota bacterium]